MPPQTIPHHYYQQIKDKFDRYNSYDTNPKFEFYIKHATATNFTLAYIDTLTRFQFEQTFWFNNLSGSDLSTKIGLVLGLYHINKDVIEILCDMYHTLAESTWTLSSNYRDKHGTLHKYPNFSVQLTNQDFHNDILLRITSKRLIASTSTLMSQNQGDSVIRTTELETQLSLYTQKEDIEKLVFDVLTRDLTYQFKKHFGDKLLDY